jgi:hypothetical protein
MPGDAHNHLIAGVRFRELRNQCAAVVVPPDAPPNGLPPGGNLAPPYYLAAASRPCSQFAQTRANSGVPTAAS